MSLSHVPRLKDVAKEANVSLAAASRILRGDKERFGEETCRRVLEASRKLGWRRNLLVNGMQTGRTQTIGVMIPPFDSFWVTVLSGIHDALAEYDYLPITVWIGNLGDMPHFEKEDGDGLKQINRLLDRRVDGLIMWPTFSVSYYHHFPEFVERRVPVAVIDKGDPYQRQIERTTEVVWQRGAWPGRRHLCYQSKVGASKWLRPSMHETIKNLAAAGRRNILVIPISFVSDHVETLHEIDIEHREQARSLGIPNYRMTPGLNDSPAFIGALARLVRSHVAPAGFPQRCGSA